MTLVSTEAEITALRAMGLKLPAPRDASSMRRPRPEAVSHARRPLNLTFIDGPEDDAPPVRSHAAEAQAIVAESVERLGEKANNGASIKDIFELAVAYAIEVSFDAATDARELVAGLRKETSELRAALVEARHEVRELKLVQESMRVAGRGERGVDGARGVPGRDGRDGVGAQGPRGEPGPPGKAAARIVSWDLDPEKFAATPLLSDGTKGAVLHCRSFFEVYDGEVDAAQAAEEIDADQAQRAGVEREASRVRAGLPAR